MKPTDTHEAPAERANPPGEYHCEVCGERLSGPAFYYTCPQMPVESLGRAE